jgi:hypothetical protein
MLTGKVSFSWTLTAFKHRGNLRKRSFAATALAIMYGLVSAFQVPVAQAASLSISGSPATTTTVNKAWSFKPTVAGASGKLTFSIRNHPGWTNFDKSTGTLSGTPKNSGTFTGVSISVTDGKSTATLPTFSVRVNYSGSGGTGGGGSGGGTGGGSGGSGTPTGPLAITGSPSLSVTAGSAYSFQPTVSGASGTLTWSIANKPSWATFNASTGLLSGTPSTTQTGTYSGIGIAVTNGTANAALVPFAVTVNASTAGGGGTPVSGAPRVLYTDVISGPTTGGENNNGAYLSIFGANFGSSAGSVSVTIGGGAVAKVIYLGKSNGRPDIQQLSVQLGPNVKTGAIVVNVGGVASNSDQTFTVSSGNIYFIDNVNGSDSNAGTFAAPFKSLAAISDNVRAGDFMVMKGTSSTPYTTSAGYYWGVRVSGSSTTSAITLMGYPGQFPYINAGNVTKAGIYNYDGSQIKYINIAGIKLEAAGTEGAVDVEDNGAYWRVVNNELTMLSAGQNGVPCNAAAIAGFGTGEFWVGNHIHDTKGTSQDQTHGIYVNNGTGTYEIAYNWIENVYNGTGIQLDGPQGASASTITAGAHIHHNIVHDTLKYGIELGNYGGSSGNITNIAVWDNLVYNTKSAGLIFNTITSIAPLHAVIYNNTFYNVATGGGAGAIDNDNGSDLTGMAITFTNNIVMPHSGSKYFTELSGSAGLANIAGSNNLFSGGSGSTLGSGVVSGAPSFASPPAATVSSSQALPSVKLTSGAGVGAGSASVATGNGIAAMTFLPAFTGVNSDLTGKAIGSGAISVGAVQ